MAALTTLICSLFGMGAIVENEKRKRIGDVILNTISRDITLKRRTVQSYVEIGLLPLEDSGSSIAANHTFHRLAPRGM